MNHYYTIRISINIKREEVSIQNIKLLIEYDGTNYCGWQSQKEGATIQKTLETTIEKVVQHKVTLISSGRTDAGVHAIGQVANFKTDSTIEPHSIKLAFNSLLPPDIVIHNAEYVPIEFHSRFDAKRRWYRYQLLNREHSGAILRNIYTFYPYPLDVERIKQAIPILRGEHDFAAFRSVHCGAKNTVRTLEVLNVGKINNFVIFDFEAQSFLHSMVRIIVGTLLKVGQNKLSSDDLKNILESRDRTKAGPTAPPQGLILMKVFYSEQ